MLGTLDRYIIRQFLGTFFFILITIMAVAVVFDISEKAEDFAEMTASTHEIVVDYYVNFIIYYANLFSGLFIFLAVILFTGRLAHRSEVIAMLSSGVSFPRLMRPYMVAATALFALSLYTNHILLPEANKSRLAFEYAYIRMPYRIDEKNLHREIEKGTIVYFETFNVQKNTGYQFSLEKWSGGELLSKLSADRAVFDSLTGVWHLYDWRLREAVPAPQGNGAMHAVLMRDRMEHGAQRDTLIALVPKDLGQRQDNAKLMKDSELTAYIEREKARGGGKTASFEIEKHQRTAYPFASFVFTLIGVSIASRKVRGGTGVHLALGVLIVLLYIFSMQMTTVAATNAGFDTFTAVWLPNVIFTVVGLWIYRRAPK
jgi:lipopolysaccharide export system permease protein